MSEPVQPSFYDAVGGEETFTRLVTAFYAGVADDPLLRPLYPDADLGPARERLTMFLVQYWGGPRDYSEQRGHPRLRMRHAPFPIGPDERDARESCCAGMTLRGRVERRWVSSRVGQPVDPGLEPVLNRGFER